MTIDQKWLKEYCNSTRVRLTPEQTIVILERFGTEPDERNVWSEEDICRQIRKIQNGRAPDA